MRPTPTVDLSALAAILDKDPAGSYTFAALSERAWPGCMAHLDLVGADYAAVQAGPHPETGYVWILLTTASVANVRGAEPPWPAAAAGGKAAASWITTMISVFAGGQTAMSERWAALAGKPA